MTSSMNTTTRCPKCGTLHRVNREHLGLVVACINCKTEFTAQEQQATLQNAQQEDDPLNLAPLPEETSQQSHPPISHYGLTPQHNMHTLIPMSNMAIASLCCGIAGLFTCCFLLPSILAIVFGAVSLGSIRAGQTRGRGLAIAGIVTGIIGSLLGILFWIISASGPEIAPIPGQNVSEKYRQTLKDLGALQDQEEIILFYSNGFFSIKETGLIITADRLVTYNQDLGVTDTLLADITLIDFMPGDSMLDMSQFTVETENEDPVFFEITTQENGDRKFYDTLRHRVSEARKAMGKPTPTTQDR